VAVLKERSFMTRAVALAAAVLLTALPGEAQVLTDVPIESPRSGGVVFRWVATAAD
jgi:hypothetical protein